MSARDFLDNIESRKRDAAALGSKLDLIVLPKSFADTIAKAAVKEDLSDYDFHVSESGNVYLVGVKVLWSSSRLPASQAWFRYSNSRKGLLVKLGL